MFIGDIVGSPGRKAVSDLLPGLRDRFELDLVIANGENAAGGNGITPDTAAEIYAAGVDVITCGDHLWDQKEVEVLLNEEPRFVRPVNYPAGTPGQGSTIINREGLAPVGIINAQGNTFMRGELDNPFRRVKEEIKKILPQTSVILLDFHAEATSEKVAMGWHLDGRASAVVGTHTHVPTADERILPNGTAHITDVGMTGCYNSVIGMEKEGVLKRFINRVPARFEVASGSASVCGVVIEVDSKTGHSLSIRRVRKDEKQ